MKRVSNKDLDLAGKVFVVQAWRMKFGSPVLRRMLVKYVSPL